MPTLVTLDNAEIDDSTGCLVVRAYNELTGEDDVEDSGQIDLSCALGLTARPYPGDADGQADGVQVIADGVKTVVGARDERCAHVYGDLAAGDSALHSVDPDASSQVQCKATRKVVAVTKGTNDKHIIFILDGENDEIRVQGFKCLLRMTPDTVVISEPGGAMIQMEGGMISLVGNVTLGGITPAGPVLAGSPGAEVPVPGVFVGF